MVRRCPEKSHRIHISCTGIDIYIEIRYNSIWMQVSIPNLVCQRHGRKEGRKVDDPILWELVPSPFDPRLKWQSEEAVSYTGGQLQQIRKRMRKTQGELARLWGVTQGTVSHLEGAKDEPIPQEYADNLRRLLTQESLCQNCWYERPGRVRMDCQGAAQLRDHLGLEPEDVYVYRCTPLDLKPATLAIAQREQEEAAVDFRFLGPFSINAYTPEGEPVKRCRYCGDFLIPTVCPVCFASLPVDGKQRFCHGCGHRLVTPRVSTNPDDDAEDARPGDIIPGWNWAEFMNEVDPSWHPDDEEYSGWAHFTDD
jgi:DNA-binding XRE family transcriptional regulator